MHRCGVALLLVVVACASSQSGPSDHLRDPVKASAASAPDGVPAGPESGSTCNGGIDACGYHPAADVTPPAESEFADGAELLGTKPHAWNVDHWMNSAPLTLAALRGRVVLVRWMMSTKCKFCSATAPSLREFDEEYRSRGLTIVGFYHHKEPGPLDPATVEETVRAFGFKFPVAIDTDWGTLKDWWIGENRWARKRRATSVSFLIDKRGTIRFIHPGPKYEPGSDDEKQVRAQIEQLVQE